ncbi:PREDICTED: uncharacterized protein LOC100632560 [Amphimedon queenslandica]|uniref:Uncharacterized protein n=2 Tax=Amphimedon queenslandica TaxID=400682 RepID=A0AAN0IJQ5_AMPQE|nr:PREDICTED: uncharacterized protein LOC100632560 [Amphimedon queenslandica]|eukprot:XP_003391449.2 PREDICTED: uncharacterized protein LOC100632560 [Amphimedon queenslandica]
MRYLMTRIDMNPQFSSHDPSQYETYVSFILLDYPELGHHSHYPHNDYTKRLDLYRLLEEKCYIVPQNIEALTGILGRLGLLKLKTEIEEDFALLLRDVDSLQLKKTFRSIQSKMNQSTSLPRIYYILETLLTENAKRDNLLSMYQSLQMRDLNGLNPLWYMFWVLNGTQNERLATLIPNPPPSDWTPTESTLLLRMILVSVDISLRDPAFFNTFTRTISSYNDYIGSVSNYPPDRFDLRMDLYRRLEESSVISTSNIEPLLNVLEILGLKALKEEVAKSFASLSKAEVKRVFDALMSKLDIPRVLPRVYYLLEYLLTDDAKSNDLYSMYFSLSKRNLDKDHPLWYIAWALSHTYNESLVKEHMDSLLVDNPIPHEWMPPNPKMMLRLVMVRMDLSEEFRDRDTYINFIRIVSPQDEYIGIPESFPFNQQMERMNFYRRLENVKLIRTEDISAIINGLRGIGEIKLLDRVSEDSRRFFFSHRKVTPTGYYSSAQLAHFNPSSPLYSMHGLDSSLPPPPPPPSQSSLNTPAGPMLNQSGGQSTAVSQLTGGPPPPPVTREGGGALVPSSKPPDYNSVVSEYQYHPPKTPDTMTGPTGATPLLISLLAVPSLEERIWINGESGEDIVRLCIKKLLDSYIFPDDKQFMLRVAHVMSRFGNPPFPLCTDGGIWQVSLFAHNDNLDTRTHVRLTTKYEKISRCFQIDWTSVERRHLEIPMYSAIAARLYLSNFAEAIPPAYKVEEQAKYWWEIYMMRHESKHYMKKEDFNNTIRMLSGQQ